jgi:hypothetical protein
MQTTISRREMEDFLCTGTNGAHESLMRSFHILARVKDLLALKTPAEVILEMIEIMESK